MTTARPQPDPAALADAARRLQEAAAPLLARRVPLDEIIELAHAARVYAAEYAAGQLTTSGILTHSSPAYRGGLAATSYVKAALLPLVTGQTDDQELTR